MHAGALCVFLMIPVAAAYNETIKSWSCPQSPAGCLSTLSDLDSKDDCQTTSECPVGAQCCYRGCFRKCEFPDPCEQVICQEGYLCEARKKPCHRKPCQLQAVCLAETQVRCVAPTCDTAQCQPGYERAKDRNACPVCDCVKKQDCGTNCLTLCAHGFELRPDGCPLCLCKPEPHNLCSDMTCGPGEECRFVQATCLRAPCPPVAVCVSISLVQYENACSLTDPTTVGLPVLISKDNSSELDCLSQSCPDNTVCTRFGREINRCCWQSTQERVLSPPKVGECPPISNSTEPLVRCQVDGACPGEQKCCHRRRDAEFSPAFGYCMNPIIPRHGDVSRNV